MQGANPCPLCTYQRKDGEKMPKRLEIAFSSTRFDQWRLSEAGGHMAFKGSKPVFRFENQQQYQKYLDLNEKRPALTS